LNVSDPNLFLKKESGWTEFKKRKDNIIHVLVINLIKIFTEFFNGKDSSIFLQNSPGWGRQDGMNIFSK
jgi:hypothetical protein